MHMRIGLSAALGVLLLVAAPVAAYASVGVGVQAGPVRLAGAAHRSEEHTSELQSRAV
jgi:hypothetical protein